MRACLWLLIATLVPALGCSDGGADDDDSSGAGSGGASAAMSAGAGGGGTSAATGAGGKGGAGDHAMTGSAASGGGGSAGTGGKGNDEKGSGGISGMADAGGTGGDPFGAASGGSGAMAGVCDDDYRIMNEADIAKVADCTVITRYLTVDAPGLTSVTLPLLTSVGTLDIESTNTTLTSASFPALETIDVLDVTEDVDGVLTDLDLPVLATVNTIQVMYSQLPTLEFPKLTRVTNTLRVSANAKLTKISFPSLASTGEWFISDNPVLDSMSAPKLTTVEALDKVTDNPKLPTCQAQAIRDQLDAFSGETMIEGNDDSATCP